MIPPASSTEPPRGSEPPRLPEPPSGFGSYDADEVTFLLTDLTGSIDESSLEEREQAVRYGGHYSERLPIEYEPTELYLEQFEAALVRNSAMVALAVAVSAERTVAARGLDALVLVSLARAGTPVGILFRRYLLLAYGIDVPHYSVSIIRDRGLDAVAMAWIADRHPGAVVQFVDGWTGKGAIQRELDSSAAARGLDPRLAVVTDPGWCAALPGSRDDFLVPSACLNSTVSGLVSRTVLRSDLIGPAQFHGAKVYKEFADRDVSVRYVDTIVAKFDDGVVSHARAEAATPIEPPDWSGWAAVEAIGRTFGLADMNLVKPGVGESTRVLLRRLPERLLLRTDEPSADLLHLVQLADERGVPTEVYPDMPYNCCGIIAGD